MATSYIKPLHINAGKTIAQCLKERTSYSKNYDKTKGGKLISSYCCNSEIADAEFLLSKREYENITGRKQQNNIIAYHLRQAFKPGTILPEQANKLAYALAMKLTKGQHAFIVATHIDKQHIHSHIIFNSTTLDCTHKFRNFKNSYKAIRGISDRICLEQGLNIIESPSFSRGHYGTWLGDKKVKSHKEELCYVIDQVLEKNPGNYDEFLNLMAKYGYEYKDGKLPGFRYEGHIKFTRLRTLPGYSKEDIYKAINANSGGRISNKNQVQGMNMLIDIQNKMQDKGVGYKRWESNFNIKQMAQTLNFLQENNLLEYDKLYQKTLELTNQFHYLSTQIKVAEERMGEIAVIKKHIINYSKTKDTYSNYRKAGYSKKYLHEHEKDILLHRAAKHAFNSMSKPIPKLIDLQKEYAQLLSSKKKIYKDYNKIRSQMKESQVAKANVERILDLSTSAHKSTREDKQH